MPQKIRAIYEKGVLKPVHKLDLPEQQAVEILVLENDLSAALITQVADKGGSYHFLSLAEENVYSADDGEGIN